MATLFDHFDSSDDHHGSIIRELRLGRDLAMILLFTPQVENVRMHFESDPGTNSYIVCPIVGCPICHIGSKPDLFHLLPVLNLECSEVEVLRVPDRRGPGSLGMALGRHLKDPDIASKVLMLSREANKYRVETRPLSAAADRGAGPIAAFVRAYEAGEIRLADAFPVMTPEEIAEIPRVRRKLDTIGGYTPPNPSAGCGNTMPS